MIADDTVAVPKPPGWGEDRLSEHLEFARTNQFVTVHNARPSYQKLSDIDACFVSATGMKDPGSILASVFLLRCHSAFRAACGLSLACVGPETFVLLRSCLEYAGYSAIVSKRPDLAEIWLRRHESDAAQKKVRKHFTAEEMKRCVRQLDPESGRILSILYEKTIDHGAHPNERATTGSMLVRREDGAVHVSQIYLHDDPKFLLHMLKTVAQVGVCSLSVFAHVFPTEFQDRGITDRLPLLRNNL